MRMIIVSDVVTACDRLLDTSAEAPIISVPLWQTPTATAA
jgi:hypothetical protein